MDWYKEERRRAAAREKEARRRTAEAKEEARRRTAEAQDEAQRRTAEAQERIESIKTTLTIAVKTTGVSLWTLLRDDLKRRPLPIPPPPPPQRSNAKYEAEPLPTAVEIPPEPLECDPAYQVEKPPTLLETPPSPRMGAPQYVALSRPRFGDRFKAMVGLPVPDRGALAFRADNADWEMRKKEITKTNEVNLQSYEAKSKRLNEAFVQDHAAWEKAKQKIAGLNEYNRREHEERLKELEESFLRDYAEWEKQKRERETRNEKLEKQNQLAREALKKLRQDYRKRIPHAVAECCTRLLLKSEYPASFRKEIDADYEPATKTVIVEYLLPPRKVLPTVVNVTYIQSQHEFKEKFLSEAALNDLYDDFLIQVALRSVHELFASIEAEVLDAIAFNGWVRFVDKATGKTKTACILSMHVSRAELLSVNLARVDPKECFRALKGVGSAKLHGISPVAPILQINRKDKRFVSSYDVAHQLDASYNIAAMDWEDFEHLIRELFEKEFTQTGGEVKVTQASHDGGVDAIAFDPDPIRGGKIVIQAKRYTNIVGISAVRDLYGTVINEGATKGILITTADYGPDAYTFAKGKPLTLLNGGNLLHMLSKHGYRAKIDLGEAKQILAERAKE